MNEMTSEIKIQIGSGTRVFEGFDNLDNSPAVWLARFPKVKKIVYQLGFISEEKYRTNWSGVKWCEVSRGLPYKDKTVSKIYSSHFLEHLTEDQGRNVLRECHRVLKEGGVMRLVVPDLLFHAKRYVEQTEELISKDELARDRLVHDEFIRTVAGGYLEERRFGLEHRYMYDLPTLVSVLFDVGFQKTSVRDFQIGDDMELASLDNRPNESLHLEIHK